jgi:hypothetical protein
MDDEASDMTGDAALLRVMNKMNEAVLQPIEEQLANIHDEDTKARYLGAIAARLPDLLGQAADRMVSNLLRSAPSTVTRHMALDDAYIASIAERWGDGLDLYRVHWAVCHENGAAFSSRHFNIEGYEPAPMLHAQIGLHALACRVALEVLALLRNGLGAGALARARTLHEISTISVLLANHGAPDGDHPDLAVRYLLHANIVTWLDAVEYQDVAPKLGFEPHTDLEMDELKAARDAAVRQHGEPFGKPHGWAACLSSNGKAPSGFKQLELLAGTDHMRSHYSLASHEVHADAKSWIANHETVGEVVYRNTGPSPRGMADAAQIALISLNRVTVNTLYSAPDVGARPADLLAVDVLNKLVERACDAFVAADEANEADDA